MIIRAFQLGCAVRCGMRLINRYSHNQSSKMPLLVTTDWLSKELELGRRRENLCVIHASHDGCVEYRQNGHIPNSLCFDLTVCRDQKSPYKNMFPSQSFFENYVGKLGVTNESHVVVYDSSTEPNVLYAARVYFMFYAFGHQNLSILDGGFAKWQKENKPCSNEEPKKIAESKYTASLNQELFASFEEVQKNADKALHKKFQLTDARGQVFYDGKKPSHGFSGHIPGAVNLPATNLLQDDGLTFKSVDDLRRAFQQAGIDLSKPIVSSCGTGISACGVIFAAHICGKEKVRLYDGSWHEWNMRGGKPNVP